MSLLMRLFDANSSTSGAKHVIVSIVTIIFIIIDVTISPKVFAPVTCICVLQEVMLTFPFAIFIVFYIVYLN